ncbi:MAG: hypothetical protein IPK48_15280 [Gammaproteobacteria bacterium]|nr:hypothetical protein [Gammaproteobacteria bacterium]
MTLLVIAIALALPTALYLVVASLQQLAGGLDAGNRLTLYLHQDAAPKAIDGLLAQLREHAGVSAVQFISAEQGLAEFKASSGFGDALDLLDRNPLPPVAVVTARDQPSAAALTALADEFAKLPPVDEVQIDTQWVARVNAIAAIGRQAVLALATVLALGVLLIGKHDPTGHRKLSGGNSGGQTGRRHRCLRAATVPVYGVLVRPGRRNPVLGHGRCRPLVAALSRGPAGRPVPEPVEPGAAGSGGAAGAGDRRRRARGHGRPARRGSPDERNRTLIYKDKLNGVELISAIVIQTPDVRIPPP